MDGTKNVYEPSPEDVYLQFLNPRAYYTSVTTNKTTSEHLRNYLKKTI